MISNKFLKILNMPKTIKFILISLIFSFGLRSNAENMGKDMYLRREHSLTKPFQGAGMNVPYWDFMGHTMITNSFIRLTPDLQSKSGAIWNIEPVYNINWEVQVGFKVHGKGTELFGDGLVIWYVEERMQPGPVFGSKNYFKGLAVILDTYSNHNGPHNHQHPYISAMVNNGSLKYDHDMDGTHTQLDGCEARFRNVDYDTQISIRYENDVLTVSTDLENKGEWKKCFEVQGVELPVMYYFGVSATTGDLSDNHDITFFKYFDLEGENFNAQKSEKRYKIIPKAKTFTPHRERVDDPKPGMSNAKIFFLLLFGMLSAIAITIFGVSWYKERNSRKRFY